MNGNTQLHLNNYLSSTNTSKKPVSKRWHKACTFGFVGPLIPRCKGENNMHHSLLNTLFKSTALVALGVFGLSPSTFAQIRYELVVPEISGTPINRVSSKSNEINENGETLLNRVSTFAVWNNGTVTNIINGRTDYPASFSSISANSINRFQQAVGSKTHIVRNEDGTHFDSFPFYWDPNNGIVDLDDLGERAANGAGATSLYAINEAGLALGQTRLFDGNDHAGNQAFTWSFEKGRTDISALSSIDGYSITNPEGLNADGAVVGIYRQFTISTDSYNERAFIFDPMSGSKDLSEIDASFFQGDHYTARDINDDGTIVGERDRNAYIYNVASATGQTITSSDESNRTTRAYALNDNNVVAGVIENRSNAGRKGHSPIIWTPSTGTIELLSQIERELRTILPAGTTPESCNITPKAINNSGQISASISTPTTFSREAILQPVLEFHWHNRVVTSQDGVRGVLYTHQKSNIGDSIPAAALGYAITFECSSDMASWSPMTEESNWARHSESEETIELFVPFSECLFIRPTLKSIDSEIALNL